MAFVSQTPTILVFDSGLGGLTVFREIVRLRPGARYVYVADDAYFPYGQHTEEEIVARVVPLIGELIEVTLPGADKERFLRVLCATGRRFALPVPKSCKTALAANAWTYDVEVDVLKLMETRT